MTDVELYEAHFTVVLQNIWPVAPLLAKWYNLVQKVFMHRHQMP